MVNPIESLKKIKTSLDQIPTKYRLLTSLGFLVALLVALPITISGLMTGNFELRKRAASGEVTPTPPVVEQKTLVIMFNFQDQPDNKPFSKEEVDSAFFSGTRSLNSYYKEVSFNQLGFTGTIVGWYTIPYNTTCSWDENMRQILLNKVEADGININDYLHLIYLKPYVDGCSSTASLGGNPSEMYLVGTLNLSTLIHEMGHNLSLGYAASLNCGSKAIDSYANCQVGYYGDVSSPQGMGTESFHHNAFHKLYLNWIPPSRIQEVTMSGDYTIYPIETAGSGIQVLKIRKPDTNEYYFLEYRQPIGFDLNLSYNVTSGALLHVGFLTDRLLSSYCELIHCSKQEINTYLIDTHPESIYGFEDAAFKDGTTFYDEANHISINQINHDQNSVTVSINLSLVPTPTSTPTPVCKTGLNLFSVYNLCSGGFRNARYMCYDRFSEILGDPTSCKSSDVWRKIAEEACRGHSSCPSPTPTPTPIPCTPEGKTMPVYPGYECCSGLVAISTIKPDQYGKCPLQPPLGASVCTKCGNKICGLGENKCNCPNDCLGPTPTPIPTIIPTPIPTVRPTPPPPRKCPGTCLPNFICRLLRGRCISSFTCPSFRGFSRCCCLLGIIRR